MRSNVELMANKTTKSTFKNWRKVLYERQQEPDNFVDDSFLECLQKDVDSSKFNLKDAVLESFSVTSEIASVVILLIVFLCLSSDHRPLKDAPIVTARSLSSTTITFLIVSLVTVILYLTLMSLSFQKDQIGKKIKNAIIFIAGGFSVSPILKTLTETISTNTIYTMFGLMMLTHLIFYDYGAKATIVNRHVSLNAAIFGAVCLASRLSSSYNAFCLLVAATDIFIMSSMLREKLRALKYTKLLVVLTIILSTIAFTGLLSLTSAVYPITFALLLGAINLACPYGFYKLQKYKTRLHGPWDEATIDLNTM